MKNPERKESEDDKSTIRRAKLQKEMVTGRKTLMYFRGGSKREKKEIKKRLEDLDSWEEGNRKLILDSRNKMKGSMRTVTHSRLKGDFYSGTPRTINRFGGAFEKGGGVIQRDLIN